MRLFHLNFSYLITNILTLGYISLNTIKLDRKYGLARVLLLKLSVHRASSCATAKILYSFFGKVTKFKSQTFLYIIYEYHM